MRMTVSAILLEGKPDAALTDEVVVPDQVGWPVDRQLVNEPAVDVVSREDVSPGSILNLGVE
jgi:hypothetical protein